MTLGVDDHVEVDLPAVLPRQRVGEPLPVGVGERVGDAHGGDALAVHRRRRPSGTRQGDRHRAVGAGQRLLDQGHRRRERLAVEQRRDQPCLVLDATASRVGQRVAQVGVVVDRLAEGEQLVGEPADVVPGGPHDGHLTEVLERVGQVAGDRPAPARRPRRRRSRCARSTLPSKISRDQAGLGLGRDATRR